MYTIADEEAVIVMRIQSERDRGGKLERWGWGEGQVSAFLVRVT